MQMSREENNTDELIYHSLPFVGCRWRLLQYRPEMLEILVNYKSDALISQIIGTDSHICQAN